MERFVQVPNELLDKKSTNDLFLIPIEQIVAFNLELLFPDF